MQLDSAEIFFEPLPSDLVEGVARAIVDDEEDLATSASPNELLQKFEKRAAVELGSKAIAEAPVLERDRSEDVSGLALSECIYSRLLSDS